LSQNTRDSKLSYCENQKSLSHLGSDQYRVVTDTKTELHAIITLLHVKTVKEWLFWWDCYCCVVFCSCQNL